MPDPIQVGTIVTAVTSFVGSVALYIDKRRTEKNALALAAAVPKQEVVAYDRDANEVIALRAEAATLRSENAGISALRTEVAALRGENAGLRVSLAELGGEHKALKARVDQNSADVAGVLSREHTEAAARGKLMSRVEYMIGTIEGERRVSNTDEG